MSRDATLPADAPGLSIVIVNWNGAPYLDACLASAEGPDREVIVVDNGSSDGSAEMVAERHPRARWLENGENLGFAVAANRGLAAARGRHVVFLNPDARANEAAIGAVRRILETRPDAGLVGVSVRDPSGAQVPTVEPFLTLGALMRARASERARAPEGTDPIPVDWMHGVFLAGRRAELSALGGFDERFFLYAEDMDLCFRVRASGRKVLFLPDVWVEHDGNRAGQELLGESRPAAGFASALLFYEKYHGPVARIAMQVAAAVSFGSRALLYSLMRSPRAERYWALAAVAAGASPLVLPPVMSAKTRG